jgi:hypothetical protein
MALAVLLEGMQAFTPDRHADVIAAAVLPAEFLIRAPRRIAAIRGYLWPGPGLRVLGFYSAATVYRPPEGAWLFGGSCCSTATVY